MNEATRKVMMTKTRQVYGEHITVLRALVPVVEAFDGKVLNKKFDTAMNEAIPKELKYNVKCVCKYDTLRIELYNSNRDYREVKDSPDAYVCTNYVDGNYVVYIGDYKEVVDWQTSAKGRIKAAPIMDAILDETKRLEEYVMRIADAEKYGDQMKEELVKISDELQAYKDKYGSSILNLLGLNFSLRYQGDLQYKNYSVREVY